MMTMITPAKASELLTRNVRNRRPSEVQVCAIASDMSTGRWKPTPAPIIVKSTGELIDGQHRLMAIVRSGVSCLCNVEVWDDEIFDVIDKNKSRTTIDRVHTSAMTVRPPGIAAMISSTAGLIASSVILGRARLIEGPRASHGTASVVNAILTRRLHEGLAIEITNNDEWSGVVASVANASKGPALRAMRCAEVCTLVLIHDDRERRAELTRAICTGAGASSAMLRARDWLVRGIKVKQSGEKFARLFSAVTSDRFVDRPSERLHAEANDAIARSKVGVVAIGLAEINKRR